MRILKFVETPVGFYLEDPQVNEENTLIGYYTLNPFPFQADAERESGEIVFFDFVFLDRNLSHQLDVEINYASEIPGRYTVPELGVEDATFKEVLEAVKRYYEERLSSRQSARTTA